MENRGIVGVTAAEKIVAVHLTGLRLDPAGLGRFLARLADLGLDLTGLHQYGEEKDRMAVSFTLPDLPETPALLEKLRELAAGASGALSADTSAGAVSIVGGGVIDAARVTARALECLSQEGVAARSLAASTLSVTIHVPRADVARAVARLHRDMVEAATPPA